MVLHLGTLLICACACLLLHLDQGSASKEPCVFPFTFAGKNYYDCTTDHSLFSWCALSAEDPTKWKYCTVDDHAQCVFPFIYNKKEVTACTEEGSLFRKTWCSLSANYDKDKAWKFCY